MQYSTNNSTWVDITGSTINSSNHTPSSSCVSKTVTIAGAPVSSAFYIRFSATWSSGDYYLYFDEVSVSQGAPPSCLAPTGLPSTNVTSNSATISWAAPSSAPSSGYEFEVRTSGAGEVAPPD